MGAVAVILFSETLLVPSSLFLTIGYHVYLRHSLTHKPRLTTIGTNSIERTLRLRQLLQQGDDKKGMLAVQTLRNTFMATILTALLTITITLCLAALINNAFNAVNHLRLLSPTTGVIFSPILGLQVQIQSQSSGILTTLKFGSAYLFLITSFLSSSMGLSYLVDANFLVNAIGDFSGSRSPGCDCCTQTIMIMERGFMLVVVGNRVLCISFTLLLWMFGPLPMLISSLALTWALYQLDFHAAAPGYASTN